MTIHLKNWGLGNFSCRSYNLKGYNHVINDLSTDDCILCGPGTYNPIDNSVCSSCPPGQYCPNSGMTGIYFQNLISMKII